MEPIDQVTCQKRPAAPPARVGPDDDVADPARVSRHDAMAHGHDPAFVQCHAPVEAGPGDVLQDDDIESDLPLLGGEALEPGDIAPLQVA